VEPNETRTLVRLVQRRPRSFSEAADSVLDALAEAIPGVIALGRLELDEQVHRVIETRGDGLSRLSRGVGLPAAGGGDTGLDAEFLRSLGAQAWLGAPLETSDGRIVGVLCALDPRDAVYGPPHAAQLGVAARLLGHEWESVELRSEVRRLRRRIDAGPGTDPDTGLPSRETFLELLDREWRLAERGTVQSVLVVCRIGGDAAAGNGDGGTAGSGAGGRLALKVTAEVLGGSARATDRVGRVGETAVAAILVGCRLRDTPAFVARFLEALGRVSEGRRPGIEVACGVQPLNGTSSPEEALGLAEAAAGEHEWSVAQAPPEPERDEAQAPVPQEALE
jgi:GGDEF domain-containing protein